MDKPRAKWPLAVMIVVFTALWLFHTGFFIIMLGFASEPGGGGGITFSEFLVGARYIILTSVIGIGAIILWRRGFALTAYILCALVVLFSLDQLGILGFRVL